VKLVRRVWSMRQSVEKHDKGNTKPEADGRNLSLWELILALIEQDLDQRRTRKLFVEVQGESGSYHKEIGELSTSERQSLRPALREHTVEQLLDRYLAEQDRVDLIEKRRVYTKKVEDLIPEDLPALVEADRWRAEEEQQKECAQAGFVRADSERFLVTGLVG